jgi:hypothetical protein
LACGHAHQHLFDDTPIERIGGGHRLERGQRDLARRRAHARTLDRDLPASQHDFALCRARTARRPLGVMGIPQAANGRAILLEHRGEDLEA